MLKNNILSEETLKHIHLQLKRMKSEFIFYCEEKFEKTGKVAGNVYTYDFDELVITNDRKDIEIKFATEEEMILHKFKDGTCLLNYINKHGELPSGIWLVDDVKPIILNDDEDEEDE